MPEAVRGQIKKTKNYGRKLSYRRRPCFWFNVAANLTADAIFEAALCLGSKLCKL